MFTATKKFKGGKDFPELAGIVTFKEVSNGVLVTAKINGLPQSDTSRPFYFSILPQAIFVPELPLGWLLKSSGISWIITTFPIMSWILISNC